MRRQQEAEGEIRRHKDVGEIPHVVSTRNDDEDDDDDDRSIHQGLCESFVLRAS